MFFFICWLSFEVQPLKVLKKTNDFNVEYKAWPLTALYKTLDLNHFNIFEKLTLMKLFCIRPPSVRKMDLDYIAYHMIDENFCLWMANISTLSLIMLMISFTTLHFQSPPTFLSRWKFWWFENRGRGAFIMNWVFWFF